MGSFDTDFKRKRTEVGNENDLCAWKSFIDSIVDDPDLFMVKINVYIYWIFLLDVNTCIVVGMMLISVYFDFFS